MNWPLHRKALSVGGKHLHPCLLGMGVHDATAGFRAYRTEALRTMGLDQVASQGYCFQVDLTNRAIRAGLRVREVPITFVEREIGDSKMSGDIMRESLLRITSGGWSTAPVSCGGLGTGSRHAPPVGRTALREAPPSALAGRGLPALLLVPILEIAAIIAVGKVIGGWQTLVLLVLESLLGAWLVRREGARAWAALTTASTRADAEPSARRRGPGAGRGHAAADPGFLTDIVGSSSSCP